MKKHFLLFLLVPAFVFISGCSQSDDPEPEQSTGLIVMAHGNPGDGGIWNNSIMAAVFPLVNRANSIPTEIAFGMANPDRISAGITNLEAQGINCIVLVRLLVSGDSFLHQTQYVLGERSDKPPFMVTDKGFTVDPNEMPPPLSFNAKVINSEQGLLDAPQMGEVLVRRAESLTDGSGQESILILAHGTEDETENDRWLSKMDTLANKVRATGKFKNIEVHTLREDWPDLREVAEQNIRAFVENNQPVMVIPFRLSGFGPYEEVLDGLTYKSDGVGLLPSQEVADWLEAQTQVLQGQCSL